MPLGQYEITDFAIIEIRSMNSGLIAILFFFLFEMFLVVIWPFFFTTLELREAGRIEMRGNILNKKGMYNRCKLTRMVIDSEWES